MPRAPSYSLFVSLSCSSCLSLSRRSSRLNWGTRPAASPEPFESSVGSDTLRVVRVNPRNEMKCNVRIIKARRHSSAPQTLPRGALSARCRSSSPADQAITQRAHTRTQASTRQPHAARPAALALALGDETEREYCAGCARSLQVVHCEARARQDPLSDVQDSHPQDAAARLHAVRSHTPLALALPTSPFVHTPHILYTLWAQCRLFTVRTSFTHHCVCRLDRTLQEIVFKLVPGLQHSARYVHALVSHSLDLSILYDSLIGDQWSLSHAVTCTCSAHVHRSCSLRARRWVGARAQLLPLTQLEQPAQAPRCVHSSFFVIRVVH